MENKFIIPASIVLAGAIVASAILYTQFPRALNRENTAAVSPLLVAPTSLEALKIRKTDFFLGNPAAKVVVVEYGDFQCPFCGIFFNDAEKQVRESYVKEGKVVLVWRDFAFLGEESYRAAEAARCAGEQGKFWEYHDILFENQQGENQGAFNIATLKQFARTIGLNTSAFGICLDSVKYKTAVTESTKEGKTLGVTGTPTSFVNGRIISGAVSYDSFKETIDEELSR